MMELGVWSSWASNLRLFFCLRFMAILCHVVHAVLAITRNSFKIVSSNCLFPSRLMSRGVRSFRAAEWSDRIERLFRIRSI